MTGQKLKYSEINLFSCHNVPHKSQLSNPGYHSQLTGRALACPGSNVDSGKDTFILMKLKAQVLHYISASNCGPVVHPCQTIQAISKVCVTAMWNLNNGLQLPILLNINSFSPVSYNYTTDKNTGVLISP